MLPGEVRPSVVTIAISPRMILAKRGGKNRISVYRINRICVPRLATHNGISALIHNHHSIVLHRFADQSPGSFYARAVSRGCREGIKIEVCGEAKDGGPRESNRLRYSGDSHPFAMRAGDSKHPIAWTRAE